jgi:hypothetical protein
MERMTKALITARLGRPPEDWDFRGQCYDVGEGRVTTCILTQKEIRFAFTLKPKGGGKGRVIIGPHAFHHFRNLANDLLIKLEAGRQFLQVFVEAERSDMKKAALVRRQQQTEKKLVSLKVEARKRLKAYRASFRRGALPEYMAGLKALMERPMPTFDADASKELWFEQTANALEQQLRYSKPNGTPSENQAVLIPGLPDFIPPAPVKPKRAAVKLNSDIPEIDL